MTQAKEHQARLSYNHFAERLKDRYNIELTFEEYKELHSVIFHKSKRQSKNSQVGLIYIKNVEVVVVKKRSMYVTALPFFGECWE